MSKVISARHCSKRVGISYFSRRKRSWTVVGNQKIRTSIRRLRPCARPVQWDNDAMPFSAYHFLLFILETTFQGTVDKHDLYTTRMCKHELRRNVIGALRSRCDKSACVHTPLRVTKKRDCVALLLWCAGDVDGFTAKTKTGNDNRHRRSIRVSSTCPVRHIFMLFWFYYVEKTKRLNRPCSGGIRLCEMLRGPKRRDAFAMRRHGKATRSIMVRLETGQESVGKTILQRRTWAWIRRS